MPNIIEINDFSAPELDVYARLNEAQLLHYYEPNGGLFIAESPKVIERALDAGCKPLSLLMEPKHITGEATDIIARCKDVPIYTAELDILTKLTGFQLTRGVLCAMHRPALPNVADVCAGARRIAVLENVVNPTNIGAIFRSAAALNMDAILLTPACSDPLYRRASRVSMGTVFQIPWTYITPDTASEFCTNNSADNKGDDKLPLSNTSTASTNNFTWESHGIELLHRLGFKTAAMALCDDSVSIDDDCLHAEEKLAIVLGTEGDGLATSTIANCDYTVKIPMSHCVDSLNVAAASAVAFWELGK